jgi:hypothetical protein
MGKPDADVLASADGSWERMLTARPMPNTAARVEELADESVALYIAKAPSRLTRPPLSWVLQPRRERRVALDRLGAKVWRLCDGKRTVEAVVDAFAERYRLTFHEARTAVTGYLRALIQRGVVAIAVPEEPKAGPAGEKEAGT